MQPTLTTDRLLLRSFSLEDAPSVQKLAGDFAIADTTLNISHPYADGMAEAWIATHAEGYAKGELACFALTLKGENIVIGAMDLRVDTRFHRAELGYWIGAPYWNRGFCTEAGRAVVDFGFSVLKLHKITAHHLTRNPASGKVMQKLGMIKEGTFKEQVIKWDRYEDYDAYGLIVPT